MQSLTDTVRHYPGVSFNVFLNKLKHFWPILASNEVAKRGSVRQEPHFYGQNMAKMAFSLSPARPSSNEPGANGACTISDARGSSGARTSLTPLRSHKPTPASHPLAPWSPLRGRPPFPSSLFLGYLNLGQWTGQPFERSVWLTDHTLLHSLLGAMFN